jgi:hypothetical protein
LIRFLLRADVQSSVVFFFKNVLADSVVFISVTVVKELFQKMKMAIFQSLRAFVPCVADLSFGALTQTAKNSNHAGHLRSTGKDNGLDYSPNHYATLM